jgi:two-component system, response regulator YesN
MKARTVYRVLLADDTPDVLVWLRSLLERSRCFAVIGEARNGCEVLRFIETLKPDAVLTDIEMPGLDGFDVARSIRQRWPTIKVILFSTQHGRSYERLAREEGAIAFIPKAQLSGAALCHALREAE